MEIQNFITQFKIEKGRYYEIEPEKKESVNYVML